MTLTGPEDDTVRPLGPFRGALGAPMAVGAAGSKTYADLAQDALAVARASKAHEGKEVLALCDDRYWLTVALLGAWQAGMTVALPPNHQEGTLAALCEGRSRDLVWRDQPEGLGVDVRTLTGARGSGALSSLRELGPEERLVTLYTSGTTAESAAWAKACRQLLGEARMQAEYYGLTSADCVLCTVPSRHIYGLLFGILAPLAVGARFVRETDLLAKGVAAKARLYEATVLVSAPAHLRALGELDAGALGQVRQIVSSGAPLGARTGRRLRERFGTRVTEVLGSTETGGIATRSGDGGAPWRPLPGVQVAQGSAGRLVVRSPYLARGGTEHVSNDRIELFPDGTFEHLGRDDGTVKVAGKRVRLDEIEALVLDLQGVDDVAALIEDVDGLRGSEIRLAVVAPGWSAEEIRRQLSRYFDASVLPRRIRFFEALPRTDNGKLRRQELRAMLASPVAPSTAGVGPD